MAEDSKDNIREASSPEGKLPHVPGQMISGLTVSPEGKRCVGLTFNEQEYLLIGVFKGPRYDAIVGGKRLGEMGIKSITSTPFDWESSVKEGKLVLDEKEKGIGVYVQSDKFDKLSAEEAERKELEEEVNLPLY